MVTQEKFARFCNATNQGMDEGFVFHDGEYYASTEEAALRYAKFIGYKSLEEAYNDGAYYYTEWDVEDESYWYECHDNVWYEVDEDGTKDVYCNEIHFEFLPKEVIDLFYKEDFNYAELETVLKKAEALGYTFDYGLDASPYNFRKL